MWIVGLGNPGPRYAGTRHNVGFDVLSRLVDRWSARDIGRTERYAAFAARPEEREVALIQPLGYMNRSGASLAAFEAAAGSRPAPEEVLVVCDDIYLPVGTIRIRAKGSTGGHRGLESIERYLGETAYPRLRIGVGHAPGEELVDHVLSEFEDSEREALEKSLENATEAATVWAREGIESAMNRFNRRSKEVHS
ncbi:MAG: aminoacyl-tRNA hydrolase [Acidobacteriota bacterium]|nr:aminoacyl-tRNA hydrolase [Acidobacteriota bacterium]